MHTYTPYLVPLVDGIPSGVEPGKIQLPIEEEFWILSNAESLPNWSLIAEQVQSEYGLIFLFSEDDILTDQYKILDPDLSGQDRFLIPKDASGYFLMEHPFHLSTYDILGDSRLQPALVKPSTFAHWYGSLAKSPIIAEKNASSIDQTTGDSVSAFNSFIRELLQQHPSDWHLEPEKEGFRSRIRSNGRFSGKTQIPLQRGRWLINSIRTACHVENIPPNRSVDGAFRINNEAGDTVSIRVSMVPSMFGLSTAARFLYPDQEQPKTLPDLGLRGIQIKMIKDTFQNSDGLWIICGPTGSGKTTTLHSLLEMSVEKNRKVLAVEDPVERIMPGVQHVMVNPDKNITFASALKGFMRQAPDTILIGEIRDAETAAIALQAAFSGHRILSTIHAGDNKGILHRFQDFQQPLNAVESAVTLVIHQRLVPILCQSCKYPVKLPEAAKTKVFEHTRMPLQVTYSAKGCHLCHNGYSHRKGIFAISQFSQRCPGSNSLEMEAIRLLESAQISLRDAFSFISRELRKQFQLPQL